jgi:hypothetical protein
MDRSKYHAMTDDQIKALSPQEVSSIASSFNLKTPMSDADHALAEKLVKHHGGNPKGQPFGLDTASVPDIEDEDDASFEEPTTPAPDISKRGRSPEAHEKAIQDLMAAREEGEKTEVPLADIVAKRNKQRVAEMVDATNSENVDLLIASTYIQMTENNLIEQVIAEMENILEETFNDEDYAMMYEYVSTMLNEKRYADPKEKDREGSPKKRSRGVKGRRTKPSPAEDSDKEARIERYQKRASKGRPIFDEN